MCSSVHVWSDARIYFKEAKSLASEGYHVEFYALDHHQEHEDVENITMHFLPSLSRLKRHQHMKTLFRAFKNSQAAYFHFHDPELLFLAKKIKKTYGQNVKVIYDMHEHLPAAILTKQWIPKPFRVFMSKWVERIEKKYMSYVDAVIFAELSYKENYRELTHLEKIDVLNYPIAPVRQTIEKEEIFTLIYVGVLTEQRGLMNMLELALELKNRGLEAFQLKLIGPLFMDRAKMDDFIARHELKNDIIWMDRMKYKDIWAHYFKAHVGLCLLHPTPNNTNSHSTKLFEYMAAGIPILASDFPGFQKILNETKCGQTVNPFDYKKAADIILKMYNEPNKMQEMGENGYVASKELYSWDNEANKLFSLYKN